MVMSQRGWQESFLVQGDGLLVLPAVTEFTWLLGRGAQECSGGGHAACLPATEGTRKPYSFPGKTLAAWLCTSSLVSTGMNKACFQVHLQFLSDECHPTEPLIMFFIHFWFNTSLLW